MGKLIIIALIGLAISGDIQGFTSKPTKEVEVSYFLNEDDNDD